MFSFIALFSAASAATVVMAHTITLTNKCGSGVPVYVDSAYSPVPYVSVEIYAVIIR